MIANPIRSRIIQTDDAGCVPIRGAGVDAAVRRKSRIAMWRDLA